MAVPPAVIVSVAHLDDEERALVLGVLLEELVAWTRGLPGSQRLRALCVFDEIYRFLPPHPANPPTKRPLVALMKQARAFGVGVVIATQNPMDLDYRALGNAGLWCLGRLQTDADRARVVDGLGGADAGFGRELGSKLQHLSPRWFLMRDVHAGDGLTLMQPRWSMSWLRGPLTRAELRKARGGDIPVSSSESADGCDRCSRMEQEGGRTEDFEGMSELVVETRRVLEETAADSPAPALE